MRLVAPFDLAAFYPFRFDHPLWIVVTWGGLLIATGNLAQATRLTLLARPLTRDGEPALGDASLGRFIAIVPEFLDPKLYAPDRRLTVAGSGALAIDPLGQVIDRTKQQDRKEKMIVVTLTRNT